MSEHLSSERSPVSPADSIFCCDIHGTLKPVPRSDLTFSPAVYGVLVENDKVLLQRHAVTRFYHPPGGRVDPEQTAQQAIRKHFRATTGVTPIVGDLLLIEEAFQIDEEEKPWHLSIMFYAIERPSVGREGLIDFENSAHPEWVSLDTLTREKLQLGYDAIQIACKRMEL